jgi:hypothetical protein
LTLLTTGKSNSLHSNCQALKQLSICQWQGMAVVPEWAFIFFSCVLSSPTQAALGPGGTEGGFRQAACATLAALRGSADTMAVRF